MITQAAGRLFRKEVQMLQDRTSEMGAIQAVEFLDSLLCASEASKGEAIRFVRDRIQGTLNEWSRSKQVAPHEHSWGPIEHSRFAGNHHRKCTGCNMVSLDFDED